MVQTTDSQSSPDTVRPVLQASRSAGKIRGKRQALGIRKEYRTLTDAERTAYHNAINNAKTTMVGGSGVSEYDTLAMLHTGALAPGAHGGAAFLPWHREYLHMYEQILRSHDPSVSLAYWDNTIERGLSNPSLSAMWSDNFMGTGNGVVNTGPFAGWVTHSGALIRNVQSSPSSLMSNTDVNNVLANSNLGQISCSNDCSFESAHNNVHGYVGGNMNTFNSPGDPLFWMHHAFIDCIWEEFRDNQIGSGINPETDYPTTSFGSPYHEQSQPMYPFSGMTNIDGCSNEYTSKYYTCAPRPKCPDCGNTDYLTCDPDLNQCVPTLGGSGSGCPGGSGSDAYQNSYCVGKNCDVSNYVYVPVDVVYVRPKDDTYTYPSYPVYDGKVDTRKDIYSVSSYSSQGTGYGSGNGYCTGDDHCCGGASGVYVQTYGENYEGVYRDYAILDRRLSISRATTYVGIRNPSQYGVTNVTIRAYDSCGRVCTPYYAKPRPDVYSTPQYERTSGYLTVDKRDPPMYRDTYAEATEMNYVRNGPSKEQVIPVYQTSPEQSLTFYCG